MNKREHEKFRQYGINVMPYDIQSAPEVLAKLFQGIKVVICAMGPPGFHEQVPLATAARIARVQRFVPCAYAPITPPKDIISIRDQVQRILVYFTSNSATFFRESQANTVNRKKISSIISRRFVFLTRGSMLVGGIKA